MSGPDTYTVKFDGKPNVRVSTSGIEKIILSLAQAYGMDSISVSYKPRPGGPDIHIIRDGQLMEKEIEDAS